MLTDFHQATTLVKVLAILLALALILRLRLWPVAVWAAAVGIIFIAVVLIVRLFPAPQFGFDYGIFWRAGRDVWGGVDPYAPDRFAENPFLHPPTALPLFAVFALLPYHTSFVVWTALNVAACMAMPLFAAHTLAAQERAAGGSVSWRPSWTVLAGLTAALVMCDAFLLTMFLGQLSILASVLLLAALAAQARGWPVLAGAWLALATAKIGTMLPFLLLFLRKDDRRAWLSLVVVSLALCLATGSPFMLPERARVMLGRIKQLEQPGKVNDYSFEGTRHESMIGFDHAFYRLGLRDRTVIRVAQYAAVLLLGAWVAGQVLPRGRLPRAAACSLVTLYSIVFLYHRSYDTVILIVPLVYSAAQARVATGAARWLFAGCAAATLLVMYPDTEVLGAVARQSMDMGFLGRVLQAVVLPYATWLLVLAMILLVRAARRTQPDAVLLGAKG
jgi:hypothetical protein